MRLLLLGLIVFLAYSFLKKLLKDYQSGRKTQETGVARMVRCDYCSVFLSEGEALTEGRHHFCCREHRDLAKGRKRSG